MERPVNRCQSPISTANPNAVSVATPRMQPSRCTTGVNSLVGGHRGDRLIETIAAIHDTPASRQRPPHSSAAGPGCRTAGRAATVRACRSRPVRRVDDALAQQQFRHPVPGGHQIPAAVLAGPHQIPGGFLAAAGNRHLGDLAQMQQPGQMRGITGIGLDPIPGRADHFDGAATSQPIPAAVNARANPNPVGPAS